MAYRPPTTSKWSTATTTATTTASAEGWQTVARSSRPAGGSSATNATPSKWGQSALKKPEPPAPKFEDEFPSLGGATKTAAVATATATATATAKPLSMAERMKLRLAEEEAERLRLAEEERTKAEEDEKNRFKGDVIPLHSFIHGRVARDFKIDSEYDDHEHNATYYNEYPDHYDQDQGLQPPYDYEEDAYNGYDDDDDHY